MRRGSDRIEKQSMEIKDGAGVEAEEVVAMKYSDRELEVAGTVVTAVTLSGVLFQHLNLIWLLLPMLFGGLLLSRRFRK